MGEKISTHLFAHVMRPITALLVTCKRGVIPPPFKWTDEADRAYSKLKSRLANPPVISFPDFKHCFILHTDASDVACGGILTQVIDGKTRLVAAVSKTFNKVEANWNTSEKECYGILWSIEKLSRILKGTRFVVHTDHYSLTYLDKTAFRNSKIARWQLRLSEYDFCLQYIKGQKNNFADWVSRPFGKENLKSCETGPVQNAGRFLNIGDSELVIYVPSWCSDQIKLPKSARKLVAAVNVANIVRPTSDPEMERPIMGQISTHQLDDPFLAAIHDAVCRANDNNTDVELEDVINEKDHRKEEFLKLASSLGICRTSNCLVVNDRRGPRVVVPEALRADFVKRAHDLNGHCGLPRMKDNLKMLWWINMDSDLENYVRSCSSCLQTKGAHGRPQLPPTGTVRKGRFPGDILNIDYVCMKTPVNGYRYMLTVICAFSRYFWAVPTRRDNAVSAALGLTKICLQYDFWPRQIHSDRGLHFVNSVIDDFCKSNKIEHTLSCAWRPEANGVVERSHRTLKNALYSTAHSENISWLTALPYVTRAMNASRCKTTGQVPREAWFGKARFPVEDTSPEQFATGVRQRIDRVNQLIKIAQEAAAADTERRNQRKLPPTPLIEGQLVYVKRDLNASGKSSGLKWVGPLRLIRTNSSVCLVEDGNKKRDWIFRGHIAPADERHEHLKELNQLHRDEELYIWQHLVTLVSDRADIHESSSKGDVSTKTKLNNIEISLPEKFSGTRQDVQKKSTPELIIEKSAVENTTEQMEISEFTPSTQADPSTLPEEQFPTAKTSNDPATSLPSEILPSDDATFMSANSILETSEIDERELSIVAAGNLDVTTANQRPRTDPPSTPKNSLTLPSNSLKAPRKRSSSVARSAPPYPKRNCPAPDRMNITSTKTKKY